jgi:hypothetical protein
VRCYPSASTKGRRKAWNAGWENRLTEIFSTVLDLHHPLAATLFARLELDAGVRVRVYTLDEGFQGDAHAPKIGPLGRPAAGVSLAGRGPRRGRRCQRRG